MARTPANPCALAVKRVSNPLPQPAHCHYCGGEVVVVNNAEIYGRSFGRWPWAYRCNGCRAYVGMHPKTDIPLGTLADAATREARKECKAPFEALHRTGKMTRNAAYQKLADKLGIPKEECHFGWFDTVMCKKAAAAAREIYLGI
ncbi:zinc-finger-containing protein [Endozoicomonas sp. ALE010]|uniref:zinc-finger-containing protein n=1 Tax=Endozoicomonas sp. ALE010 TaxID=3403081 RepID=UPI003BB52B7C